MKIRRIGDEDSRQLDDLLSEAITEDIVAWYKQWSGGDDFFFEAKADIYNVVMERFKKGVEV